MTKKNKKLVSVIVPCYNQGAFLEECIDSLIKQTYLNLEIIIVNDGSTDELTLNVIKKISEISSNILIIDIDNSGVSIARNTGINIAKGEYILPLDGDDKLDKLFIEKCVNILEENDDIDVVYTNTRLFGIRNNIYALPKFKIKKMLKRNIVVCTALFRKEVFDLVGGYNENMVHGLEDWDFWLKLIEYNKKFHRIEQILFYYRIKQISRNANLSKDNNIEYLMFKQIYDNHKNLYLNYGITLEQILPKNNLTCKLKNKLIRTYYTFTIALNNWIQC